MSSEIAIKVEGLSKCYQIYGTPQHRLKQFILPRVQRAIGAVPRKYFREFWALKNISLEVKKGETFGIIGRNGSGKSTLLQMICGTLNPSTGSIQTNGRIAALLELGSGFNPEFTGRENVYLNGAVIGLSKEEIDHRFDQIAAFADIGDFIEQPLKTYSSGMQMRLAFAVSVSVDPEILVVDEALSVGDMAFQQRCLQRLADLREAGTTILMVSHDIMLIRNYCSRAIYLNAGILKNLGDAETIGEIYLQDMFNERQGAPGGQDVLEWREESENGRVTSGSRRGRILSVSIQGKLGNGNVFRQGEVVTVEIIAEMALDVSDPEFVFQLRDGRGYVLYGIRSAPEALETVSGNGRKKVSTRLDMELSLGSGSYSITISLLNRQGLEVFTVLSKIVGVTNFSVSGGDPRCHGCINLYGRWHK